MFVIAFVSRPVLQVRPKDQNGRTMGYTFSDAVVRYGEGLQEADLGNAYRRAGGAFKGQLQQNFVVLHDMHIGGAPKWSKWRPSTAESRKQNIKRRREKLPQKSLPTNTGKRMKQP
jgi:hypothetical protein